MLNIPVEAKLLTSLAPGEIFLDPENRRSTICIAGRESGNPDASTLIVSIGSAHREPVDIDPVDSFNRRTVLSVRNAVIEFDISADNVADDMGHAERRCLFISGTELYYTFGTLSRRTGNIRLSDGDFGAMPDFPRVRIKAWRIVVPYAAGGGKAVIFDGSKPAG